MSSNLKVNTILPSTGTTIGIGTVGGLINVVGNIDVNSTSGISTFNGLEISGIVTAKAGAAVTYYGDGSNLTGISAGAGGDTGLDLNDNVKARFGTGNDLEIFHNGSSSVIKDGGSGSLTIQNAASEVNMYNTTDSEYLAQFINGGACKLYHDGSRKFETLSNGTKVTGQQYITEGTINLEKSGAHHHRILANDTGNDLGFQQSSDTGANTNFTTYLRINDGGNISLPVDSQVLNIGASQDMQLYHNGTDSYILNATGNFRIGQYNNANLKFFTSNSTRWEIDGSGHFLPDANNSFDIGSTSKRVRNIYTMDLHCSNKGSSNDVDGTWGDFTIQEGESDLFLINNRNGKKYKFNLTEVN